MNSPTEHLNNTWFWDLNPRRPDYKSRNEPVQKGILFLDFKFKILGSVNIQPIRILKTWIKKILIGWFIDWIIIIIIFSKWINKLC